MTGTTVQKRFKHLLEPGIIGNMKVRNRMVMPPMGTNYADQSGFVTERLVRYYRERAGGGMGLIIVEIAAVAPEGKAIARQIGIWADKFIPGLRHLAREVQKHGARIAIQLHHAGRQTSSDRTGAQPVAPSPIPCPVCAETPRELSIEEIEGLVSAFGHAARRAREAGFDALELHGTHGYLINQFLSPYSNRREDRYGADGEGRLRFCMEVIDSVRKSTGKDFPLIFRMNANEYMDGGLALEDARKLAPLLVERGIDCLHVSAGVYGSPAPNVATMSGTPLPLVDYAGEIKKLVTVPVIAVGKIHDPEQGEQVLADRHADFVAIGRGSITDSHFALKIEKGQVEGIRKCIQCNQKCLDPLLVYNEAAGCIYNIRAGREGDFPYVKARRGKRVVVVGGGPAGLEAARIARERGHQVVLFEQSWELGGQALLARAAPYKDRFGEILRYLIHRVEALEVDIRKGKAGTTETVLQEKPDAVILATGAMPFIPSLPGLNGAGAVTAWDILQGRAQPGKRVAIIGGGLVGCETAEFLAEKGHEVILLEMNDELAMDQSPTLRAELVSRLAKNGQVVIRTGAAVTGTQERSVLASIKDRRVTIGEIDSFVLAAGSISYNPLEGSLKSVMQDVYAVGDCERPRNAAEAIFEAFHAAYHL